MKIDEEESGFGGKSGQTGQGTDVLFPQIGEIIGSSVREESYDKLMGEIEARNIPMKDMNWYLDTPCVPAGCSCAWHCQRNRSIVARGVKPCLRSIYT